MGLEEETAIPLAIAMRSGSPTEASTSSDGELQQRPHEQSIVLQTPLYIGFDAEPSIRTNEKRSDGYILDKSSTCSDCGAAVPRQGALSSDDAPKIDTSSVPLNEEALIEWRRSIDEVLYRQDDLEARLKEEFSLRLQGDKPVSPFILVSGPSGCGTLRLAQSLKPIVEKRRGYFVMGRFDRQKSPTPYPAFIEALKEFTSMVVQRGPEEVLRVRRAVHQAVGVEAFVLTRFLPSLQDILGYSDETTTSAATMAASSKAASS